MSELSQLIFFTGLSSTSRLAFDLRVGCVREGNNPSGWIEENTFSGICDLGDSSLYELFQDSVELDVPDSDLGARWVKAFVAQDLFLHCRTEHHLHTAILAAVAFLNGSHIASLENASKIVESIPGMREWIDQQLDYFSSLSVSSLLHHWFVLVPSEPLAHYAEFQHCPVHGLDSALALSRALNSAISQDAFFLDDSPKPQTPVFYVVRLEDLPVTVLDDEYQESLLRWVGDKMILPPDYTLSMIADWLDQSSDVSGLWARMLMEKAF